MLGKDGGVIGNKPTASFDRPYLNGHGSESPPAAVYRGESDAASDSLAQEHAPGPDQPAGTEIGASGDRVGRVEGDAERAAANAASARQGSEPGKNNTSSALLPAINAERSSQQEEGQERGHEHARGGDEGHSLPSQSRHQRCSNEAGSEICEDGETAADSDGKRKRDIPGAVDACAQGNMGAGGGLELWPESAALPSTSPVNAPSGADDGSSGDGRRRGVSASGCIDADTLRAVARLFLSKLQISVEVGALLCPEPPRDSGRG